MRKYLLSLLVSAAAIIAAQAQAPPPPFAQGPQPFNQGPQPFNLGKVEVDGIPINPVAGTQDLGSFTSSIFFSGGSSDFRTQKARPVILINLTPNPTGKAYVVRLKSKGNKRVLGTDRMGFRPDDDKVIPVSVNEISAGVWTLTPTMDLTPGEYGFFVGMDAALSTGWVGADAAGGRIYGFAVVKP